MTDKEIVKEIKRLFKMLILSLDEKENFINELLKEVIENE